MPVQKKSGNLLKAPRTVNRKIMSPRENGMSHYSVMKPGCYIAKGFCVCIKSDIPPDSNASYCHNNKILYDPVVSTCYLINIYNKFMKFIFCLCVYFFIHTH